MDALHAELLGSVVDLVEKVDQLKTNLPELASDVEAIKADITESFAEFKKSTIALVGYVKQKQLDTLGSLQASETAVTAANRKTLAGFERWLWLISAVGGINTLLLIAILIKQ